MFLRRAGGRGGTKTGASTAYPPGSVHERQPSARRRIVFLETNQRKQHSSHPSCTGSLTSVSDIAGPVCGRRKMSFTQTFTSDDGFSHSCGDLLASHALSALHLSAEFFAGGVFRTTWASGCDRLP